MNFFKKPRKISWKVTMVYSLMFFMVLLLLNSSVYIFLNRYIETNIKNSISSTMQFVLPQLQRVNWWRSGPFGTDVLREISESEGNIYFRIVGYDGEIRAQSKFLQGVELSVSSGFNEYNEEGMKLVYSTAELPRSTLLSGYLQIVRDKRVESDFLELLFLILVLTSISGGAGSILIGYVITRKTLNPINRMIESVRNISASDLGLRLNADGPDDELTELARTFNSMLDRLEEAFYRQQQFVSDASHELRTPISVIKGYVDLLDRWGKEKPEIRDEAIEAIKNEVSNVKSIIESLLFLARGDSEEVEVNKELFSVNSLIKNISRETTMIVDDIDVNYNLPEECSFFGDKGLLKQMIRIFIDNSVKYTSSGGEINIKAVIKEQQLVLSIEDTGCGIPEEDIPHIFERFYQVDEARSAGEGIGLGLSIARWIIDIHQGSVQVTSREGEGTKIEVFLPLESGEVEQSKKI